MDKHDNIQYVINRVPMVALYEQMAEEAVELAHAALKLARIARGENPTPVTLYEATGNLVEELADLALVVEVIGYGPDPELMEDKLRRWRERLEVMREGNRDANIRRHRKDHKKDSRIDDPGPEDGRPSR